MTWKTAEAVRAVVQWGNESKDLHSPDVQKLLTRLKRASLALEGARRQSLLLASTGSLAGVPLENDLIDYASELSGDFD